MGLRFRLPFPTLTIHLATRADPGPKFSAADIREKKKIQQRKDRKEEKINTLNKESAEHKYRSQGSLLVS